MRETPNFNNLCQWIGLRENFNRKAPKNWWENRWFPLDFPLYPIHWLWPLKSFQMGKSWCLRPWSDPGEDPMRCLAWDPFGPVSLLGEWLESDSDSLLNLLVYWIYWVYSDPNVLLLFFFGSRRWNLTDYGCWIHPTKSIRWTPFPHSFAAPKSKLILFTYEYWATMGIFRIYIVYTLYILCIIIYIYIQYHGHAAAASLHWRKHMYQRMCPCCQYWAAPVCVCDPPKKGQIRTKNGVAI